MRNHSQIHSRMWLGGTMQTILHSRGDAVFTVAIYLITSPLAHMSGVYYCPVREIAYHTGKTAIDIEQHLAELEDEGFCHYDSKSSIVWVVKMCQWQVGENLKPSDNRVKNILNHLKALRESRLIDEFLAFYHLNPEGASKGLRRGSEGAPSPPCPLPTLAVGGRAAAVSDLTQANASAKRGGPK